ncbi:hypothetical protein B0H34DRAFT_682161 [Crassisporium funariophilum]|nr:hypothetical protein B0H34DRAFT_682161 [Crassisporium funariophilum]
MQTPKPPYIGAVLLVAFRLSPCTTFAAGRATFLAFETSLLNVKVGSGLQILRGLLLGTAAMATTSIHKPHSTHLWSHLSGKRQLLRPRMSARHFWASLKSSCLIWPPCMIV